MDGLLVMDGPPTFIKGEIMSGLKREMKIEQRAVLVKAFKVLDTAGTPSLSVGAMDGSVADTGVGIYTITFAEPFERVIGAQVSVGELNAMACVTSLSTTAIEVKVTEADGSTAADADVFVWVMGALAADET
jgi:hypothetical protein